MACKASWARQEPRTVRVIIDIGSSVNTCQDARVGQAVLILQPVLPPAESYSGQAFELEIVLTSSRIYMLHSVDYMVLKMKKRVRIGMRMRMICCVFHGYSPEAMVVVRRSINFW